MSKEEYFEVVCDAVEALLRLAEDRSRSSAWYQVIADLEAELEEESAAIERRLKIRRALEAEAAGESNGSSSHSPEKAQ